MGFEVFEEVAEDVKALDLLKGDATGESIVELFVVADPLESEGFAFFNSKTENWRCF